jgi:3-oxo-5alpha-steroid 4-dehydrogenase
MKKNEKELKNSMSRRKFLTTSGLVAGAAGMLLTGCGGDSNVDIYDYGNGNSGGTTPTENTNLPETWDGEYDFVFAGFGAASAMAAINATKEEPSAKILILEAQVANRNSTQMSGGVSHFGGGTVVQQKFGFNETEEDFINHMKVTAGRGSNEEILNAFAKHSVPTFNQLLELGLNYGQDDATAFTDDYMMSPIMGGKRLMFDGERRPELSTAATPSRQPMPHCHQPEGSAKMLWEKLRIAVEGLTNVEIKYETPVTELYMHNGRVVGVKTDTASYKAERAVLVGTGGFINNKEMVKQFVPYALECGGAGNPWDTGTGIKMAQAIGADVAAMNAAEDFYPVFYDNQALIASIAVTPQGTRYIAEDTTTIRVGAKSARELPLTYLIFDSVTHAELSANSLTSIGARLKTAATITELATQLDMPLLEPTVNSWNTYCANGLDKEFGKGNTADTVHTARLLRPIATGPFYAIERPRKNVFTLTCGGLRINGKSQVLKSDGTPIAGLYAAGSSTAHINAEFYLLGGGTAGAMVFGRIAGLEMIKEDAWG